MLASEMDQYFKKLVWITWDSVNVATVMTVTVDVPASDIAVVATNSTDRGGALVEEDGGAWWKFC